MENIKVKELKQKLAIVILAYADYESLELALATHAKFSTNAGVPIYVLQNGRGTYDCERTYAVACRYHYLFPDVIHVVDDINPGIPYHSLKMLFDSNKFAEYDYIIKLDDDVMVLTEDWIDKLCECYVTEKEQYGEELAYVTALVNNNPYGFKKIVEYSETLSKEYFSEIARKHLVGDSPHNTYAPYRILPKTEIAGGSNGTIWRYPYIARWLHKKTTLVPQEYVEFVKKLGKEEVNNKERYSINCILFEKSLWTDISDGGSDDEHMLHAYCLKFNKKIIADLSIPMVHLFFFSQRAECRDMIEELRDVYTNYLRLNFPIALCGNRMIEIENRLRFLESNKSNDAENRMIEIENRMLEIENQLLRFVESNKPNDVENPGPVTMQVRQDLPFLSRKIIGGLICLHDHGLKHTIKHFFWKCSHSGKK